MNEKVRKALKDKQISEDVEKKTQNKIFKKQQINLSKK